MMCSKKERFARARAALQPMPDADCVLLIAVVALESVQRSCSWCIAGIKYGGAWAARDGVTLIVATHTIHVHSSEWLVLETKTPVPVE